MRVLMELQLELNRGQVLQPAIRPDLVKCWRQDSMTTLASPRERIPREEHVAELAVETLIGWLIAASWGLPDQWRRMMQSAAEAPLMRDRHRCSKTLDEVPVVMNWMLTSTG